MPPGAKTVARKQKKPILLLRLPPALLTRIFSYAGVVSLSNIALCRGLMPFTLAGLYYDVQLLSPDAVKQFAASLLRRPDLAAAVATMRVSITAEDEQRLQGVGVMDSQHTFAELLAAGEGIPYDPTRLLLSSQLVQGVLKSLVNMQCLVVEGAALAGGVLTSDFLSRLPQKCLHLGVALRLRQDWSFDNSRALLRNVANTLPSLSSFALRRNLRDLPITLLNLPSGFDLAPRSWTLEVFILLDLIILSPAVRSLYSSFASLRSLYLTTYYIYDDFWDDLVRLPPSLQTLDLCIGLPCAMTAHLPPHLPNLPKLKAEHILAFPNLQTLGLSGNILSPSAWPILHTFPRLRRIALGTHVELTLPSLQAILDDADDLPDLAVLQIDICECGDRAPRVSSARARPPRRPQWPTDFCFADARKLLSAAKEQGIVVCGTVLCAAKSCNAENGHPCPGWYK
ncbi:hypothetical protein JCM10213_003302 [Rhodosporidiobolus nylandii]